MNRKKILLGIGVTAAVLALCLTAFASLHVAVSPNSAVTTALGNTVTFDGFCNYTCTINWSLIESNSSVGTINNTTGPQTTFTPGSLSGEVILIADDGNGNRATAKIVVQ
ncbi:MAG: hypothetical protein WAN69_08440 [Candidatus Korobacteraceae bacterium]|jgi:hypothetical protein